MYVLRGLILAKSGVLPPTFSPSSLFSECDHSNKGLSFKILFVMSFITDIKTSSLLTRKNDACCVSG